MKSLWRTTRGRLTLISVLVFGAALLIGDVGLYEAFINSQRADFDSQLRAQARTVADGLIWSNGQLTYGGLQLPQETDAGVAVDLAVVGTGGVAAESPNQPLSAATLSDLARPVIRSQQPIWVDLYDSKHVHRRIYAAPLALNTGGPLVLVASTPLSPAESSVSREMALIAVLSLLALFLGAALVYWLVGRVLRPVGKIASLAETLSERELHRRVEVRTPDDELGYLVRTFNRMLDRLEASFEGLRGFTADASHELRSPLALMYSEVDVALTKPRPRAEYERVLRSVEVELKQVSGLVDKLLLLARADAGQLHPASDEIDVADFIHEVTSRWAAIAGRSGVHIQVVAPHSGLLVADEGLTRRIFDNLIENAIRHSPSGAQLRVRGFREDAGWTFEVADHGEGIPVSERTRIFTRFTRLDSARSRGQGGTGLGLALAAAFAGVQGGLVRVVDVEGWGAVFQVWLPAMPNSDGPDPFGQSHTRKARGVVPASALSRPIAGL